MASSPKHSIGMFDSGIGGLTVMQQILQVLPNEHIIYFGDTARVPYGEKSQEIILRYSIENSIFLMEKNIKILVIACNTATACAKEKLQKIFNIPIIGVIEPGAEQALAVTRNERIAILGTKATTKSGVYEKEIKRRNPKAAVISIACPLFVPLVEELLINHAAARLFVKEYLSPLKNSGVDTVLLGCTHYPLLKWLIQEELGPEITIVDSATTCALKVAMALDEQNLRSQEKVTAPHRFFVTDDPEKFRTLGETFLNYPITDIELSTTNV